MNSSEAQVMMSMAYDIVFGICDHRISQNPLDPVGYHDAEDYFQYSGLYRAIERFQRLEIHSRFGMSLTEYLDLPHDYVTAINDICLEAAQREQKAQKDVEQQYERSQEKTSPQQHFQKKGMDDRSLWGGYRRKG